MAVPKKRTTKAQFGIYLNYLSSHDILRTQKMTPNCGPEIVDALWEELQGSLNSCGDGPVRTVQEWKKVIILDVKAECSIQCYLNSKNKEKKYTYLLS